MDAPYRSIPVFVRAGAIIPQWSEIPRSTMGVYPESLDLHIYLPVENGSITSLLHEDDGLTDRHLDGACLRTTFNVVRQGRRVTVSGAVEGDGFPEFARQALRLVWHGMEREPDTIRNTGRPFTRTIELDG